MPKYTDNLELFKYDVEADKKSTFNVGLALNDNFDKIDEFSKNIADSKQDVATAVRHTENISVGSTSEPVYIDAYGNAKATGKSIANERFDGQWVSSQKVLSTATAVGTYEIDLSDYLPNDNYNYEVQIFVYVQKSGDGISALNIYALNSTPEPICVSASGTTNRGLYSYFINTNRKFSIQITSKFANVNVSACAYRRIGQNI